MRAVITADPGDLDAADAVILPGIGAFRDAIHTLDARALTPAIHAAVATGKPVLGICLGMQLLLTESHEMGRYRGLDLVAGEVTRLSEDAGDGTRVKVPHVGWSRISPAGGGAFKEPLFDGVPADAFMYFVHSYECRPSSPGVATATTRYGAAVYCSALRRDSVVGVQFHPERSGPHGLTIYRNFRTSIVTSREWSHGRTAGSEIRTA